jgi:hypothetical protein
MARPTADLKPLFPGSNRLAVELDEAGGDQFPFFPATHMSEQPGWNWNWRLTLLGGALPERLAVEDPVLKIDVRSARLSIWRCGRNRARSGAGVQANQNEPSNMSQGPAVRPHQSAF